MQESDPTWDILSPVIGEYRIFANHTGPFGYGVMNGTDIPAQHIDIVPVPDAREIILASDGYEDVLPTLRETEDALRDMLRQDPLMYRLAPKVKGMAKGAVSFDDRSYIRLAP